VKIAMQDGTQPTLRKRDWLRFQLKSDRRVLEGFVHELSSDGSQVRIGKTPYLPEPDWYPLSEIILLRQQSR
jgi:hypothetical protein